MGKVSLMIKAKNKSCVPGSCRAAGEMRVHVLDPVQFRICLISSFDGGIHRPFILGAILSLNSHCLLEIQVEEKQNTGG